MRTGFGGPEDFTYSWLNEHYRAAHELCWLVLHGHGLDEALLSGPAQIRSFLINMNTLFERFIEQTLRLALGSAPVSVEVQRSDSIFWRPDTGKRYASVRPDLLVQSTTRADARLPVDAKYKRYDTRNLDVSDLTQIFLYAYAYRDPQDADAPPRAMLLHPTETAGEPRATRLWVRSVAEREIDAELTVVAIHVPTILDEADRGGGPSLDQLRDLTLGVLPGPAAEPYAQLVA